MAGCLQKFTKQGIKHKKCKKERFKHLKSRNYQSKLAKKKKKKERELMFSSSHRQIRDRFQSQTGRTVTWILGPEIENKAKYKHFRLFEDENHQDRFN